jgi:predicted RecB family endonuclease
VVAGVDHQEEEAVEALAVLEAEASAAVVQEVAGNIGEKQEYFHVFNTFLSRLQF